MSDTVIYYDPEADILLVRIREGKLAGEELLENDIVVGLDERGNPLYIEVWQASKRGLAKALAELARAKREKLMEILAASQAPQH